MSKTFRFDPDNPSRGKRFQPRSRRRLRVLSDLELSQEELTTVYIEVNDLPSNVIRF